MTEVDYKGHRIVQIERELDCHGFRMPCLFMVVDEFDDPLPIVQCTFWSPQEAMFAIDFVVDVYKTLRKGEKWPTTRGHEMNVALAYRANFINVYKALQMIRKELDDCEEMGDDPTPGIRNTLNLLHADSLNARR